jgi:hypothetical protein
VYLDLSKGPKVGISLPSPEDGNRPGFRNVMFSSYFEFWMTGKVQKPSDFEHFTCFYHSFKLFAL